MDLSESTIEKLAKELGHTSERVKKHVEYFYEQLDSIRISQVALLQSFGRTYLKALVKRIEEKREDYEGFIEYCFFKWPGGQELRIHGKNLSKADEKAIKEFSKNFRPAVDGAWSRFPEVRPELGKRYWVTYLDWTGVRTVAIAEHNLNGWIFPSGGSFHGIVAFMPYDAERKPEPYVGEV